ncbi:MAG: thioredoxin domain-containing protein, partial [Acidimicrobiales bacterium]
MNRLADETSPYLRQHADNPVDWFPWGDEAFQLARQRDCPVFLSIGYSACHWCHVMAHESFEDPDTAQDLNDRFVSIKVDREERPDVDQVYMEAVQAITGSGGWPMSVFLTPDRRPFYGGTYFPPDDRRGGTPFRTVLRALTDAWDNRRDEVDRQADELCRSMAARSAVPARARSSSFSDPSSGSGSGSGSGTEPGKGGGLLDLAAGDLAARFDPEWGGFGRAPKFPQPVLVDLALRHALRHRGEDVG